MIYDIETNKGTFQSNAGQKLKDFCKKIALSAEQEISVEHIIVSNDDYDNSKEVNRVARHAIENFINEIISDSQHSINYSQELKTWGAL